MTQIARARALEPVCGVVGFYASLTLFDCRKFGDTLTECQRVLEFHPGFPQICWMQAWALSYLGQHERAVDAAERAVTLSGRQNFFLATAACTHARAGHRQTTEAIVNELYDRSRQEYVSPLHFAWIAAALGETDQAFARLERAQDDRAPFVTHSAVHPGFDLLRDNRRFAALLKKLGLEGVSPVSP